MDWGRCIRFPFLTKIMTQDEYLSTFNSIKDPVLRFKMRSEALRAYHARTTGACIKQMYAPSKSIEKAILEDLEHTKYICVENKWGITPGFIVRLKKKYHVPINFKPKPADHD